MSFMICHPAGLMYAGFGFDTTDQQLKPVWSPTFVQLFGSKIEAEQLRNEIVPGAPWRDALVVIGYDGQGVPVPGKW